MTARADIRRLATRLAAVERRRRTFWTIVENHMNADQEIAAFRDEQGIRADDLLITRLIV